VSLYRDEALVLRTHKLGEADRIVVLLTATQGKVRAVAKGVRKTTSRHGSRLEPISHVAVQLYRGRELDTVTQVVMVEPFAAIRGDLDRLARAAMLVEAVDAVTLDRENDPGLYRLLLGALRTLDQHDRPLLVAGCLFKLLMLEGVAPAVDRCVGCDATEGLVGFDLDTGGARCRACRAGTPLPPEGFRLLSLMLGGRMGAALNEPASPLTDVLERLAVRSVERHLDRRLRSATVNIVS
jgi:DNA repair protein RecO (recombination protein O)